MDLKKIKVIAVDADDTLWDNQTYYDRAEDVFTETLKEYGPAEELSDKLFEIESANMPILGYGGKAVCISMMEAALKISEYQIDGNKLQTIISTVKSLLSIPVSPLKGVAETLQILYDSQRFRLILLTKGDMLDQENKVKRSGLGKYFDKVVIVSNKGLAEYQQLCKDENVKPEELLMIGNSFKSDISPVLKMGGYGIHIPFHTTWKHEVVEVYEHPNVMKINEFSEVLDVLNIKPLQTERITLRRWTDDDAETLFKWASNPDVGLRAGWPPHKSVEESREIIKMFNYSKTMWAVVFRETNEIIGCAGYLTPGSSNIELKEDEAEVGYWIAKPFWNKGLATEALKIVIDFCFNVKGIRIFYGDYFLDNPASGKVMEKCGFVPTGEERTCPNLMVGGDKTVRVLKLEK